MVNMVRGKAGMPGNIIGAHVVSGCEGTEERP